MVARFPPLTLSNVLDPVGVTSPQRRNGFTRWVPASRWQRIVAALADWSAVVSLAWPSETLLRERPERFQHFCRDYVVKTPMRALMNSAQAGMPGSAARYCVEQTVRVWLLGW